MGQTSLAGLAWLVSLTLCLWADRAIAQDQAAAAAPWLTAGTVKRLSAPLQPGAHHQALTPRAMGVDVARWRDARGDATTAPNAVPNAVPNPTPFGTPWRPAQSSLGLEHNALALQLDSGARLSLRARAGGPMLVLRNRF